MLDIIGEPYAFGSSILDAYSISVCTVPDKLNFGIIGLLCCLEPDFELNRRESYDTQEAISMYGLEVSSSEIVCDEATGMYELVVTVSDPAELETVTEEILESASRKNLYLANYSSEAFVGTSLDKIISDGEISFNQLSLLRMDEIPEEYRYILELIKYKLDRADYNDRRSVYPQFYYLDSYSASNDNVHFGVRAEADIELAAYIEEKHSGVDAWVYNSASPTLYIELHQNIKSGFLSEALDKVEEIFQETQLDSLEYRVVVYLIDETEDTYCHVTFNTWGESQYLECTGICMGDWLDTYSEEFAEELQSRDFFMKRDTYITTSMGWQSLTS